MAFLTIRVVPEVDDLGLYAGYLYAFRRDASIAVYDWRQVIRRLTEHDAQLWNVAELAFLRNDVAENVTALLGLDGYGSAMRRAATRLEKGDLTADLDEHEPLVELASPVSPPRDVAFYNGHLYLTGPEGVFVSTISQNGHADLSTLTRIHDFPGISLRAKYAVLAISGGHSGIFCLPLAGIDSSLPDAGAELHVDDVTSRKSSWMVEDILNIQLDGGLGYIDNATKEKKARYSHELEKKYISRLGERVLSDDEISRDFEGETIQMAFTSNQRLYAVDSKRTMHIAERTLRPERGLGFAERRRIEFDGQLYDGYSMTQGLVVDGEHGTYFFTGLGQPTLLHGGENVTVRSFNNSVYYKRLIASVKNEYSVISCIWPDFERAEPPEDQPKADAATTRPRRTRERALAHV